MNSNFISGNSSNRRLLTRLGESTFNMLSFADDMTTDTHVPIQAADLPYELRVQTKSSSHENLDQTSFRKPVASMAPTKLKLKKSTHAMSKKDPPNSAAYQDIALPALSVYSTDHENKQIGAPRIPSCILFPRINETCHDQMNERDIVRGTRDENSQLDLGDEQPLPPRREKVMVARNSCVSTQKPAALSPTWDRATIAVAPGQSVPMVGISETLAAIDNAVAFRERNESSTSVRRKVLPGERHVLCVQCDTFLHAHEACTMVLCSECKFISPIVACAIEQSEATERETSCELLGIGLTVELVLEARFASA